MNIIAVMLLFIAGLTAAAATSAPPPAASLSKYQQAQREKFNNSAPADQYFGRMKMSYLGINNTFRDAAITAGEHTTDGGLSAKVALADDALSDWANRYPRDPQLARSYFLAVAIERKIWLQANQEKAYQYLNRLATLFPASYFGKLAKRDLARGFTEHYYAAALPCPTAPPTPEPTPEPTVTPTPSPAPKRKRSTPVPSPSPPPTLAATPEPSPSPPPTPEVKELGKGHKAQIEIPACVVAPSATPSAVPSAAPAPTQAPATTASPAASAAPTRS